MHINLLLHNSSAFNFHEMIKHHCHRHNIFSLALRKYSHSEVDSISETMEKFILPANHNAMTKIRIIIQLHTALDARELSSFDIHSSIIQYHRLEAKRSGLKLCCERCENMQSEFLCLHHPELSAISLNHHKWIIKHVKNSLSLVSSALRRHD